MLHIPSSTLTSAEAAPALLSCSAARPRRAAQQAKPVLREFKGSTTRVGAPLGTACAAARGDVVAAASGSAPPTGGRNLIIALDNSPDSQFACEWVVENVYRPGDTVHVVHAVPYFPRPGVYALPNGQLAKVDFDQLLANETEYLKAAERAVAGWCWGAFHTSKVPYVIDVVREHPASMAAAAGAKNMAGEAICSKAEELQAAVVVVASHAKSSLAEFLMGSVANFLVHRSACPVLLLHAPERRGTPAAGKRGPGSWLSAAVTWLLTAGHAEASGTAAEAIATEAAGRAMAAAHAGDQRKAGKPEPAFSLSEDLEDGGNLIGQTAFGGIQDDEGEAHAGDEGAANAPRVPRAASGGRNIVLPVDDSDASSRAVAWALDHMAHKDDVLHLLHVIPTLPFRFEAPFRATYGTPGVGDNLVFYMEPPVGDFKAATERYVAERFIGMLEAAGANYEVDVIAELAEDSVASVGRAICKKAEDLDAAAVVLGSHARGGVAEFLLGSVASWVVHHSPRPVAVLH